MTSDNLRGFVEVVRENTVSGWCYSRVETDPLIVTLLIDGIPIRSRRADNERQDVARGGGALNSGFNFHIGKSLLRRIPDHAAVEVVVAGDPARPLPLLQGKSNVINGAAADKGEELRSMLGDKWHVDHWGNLKISFGKAPELKQRSTDLYSDMRSLFMAQQGLELYLTGGNLLGLIREFDYLDHDDDIDAAYCIEADSVEDVADQFFKMFDELAPELVALRYSIDLVNAGQFNISRQGRGGLDIFTAWFTSDGHYFRYIGSGGLMGGNRFRTREIEYLGKKVLIPQYAEKELDLTYGEGWKQPDPLFHWKIPRHIQEVMDHLTRVSADRVASRKRSLATT